MKREADKWPVSRPEDARACGRSYELCAFGWVRKRGSRVLECCPGEKSKGRCRYGDMKRAIRSAEEAC